MVELDSAKQSLKKLCTDGGKHTDSHIDGMHTDGHIDDCAEPTCDGTVQCSTARLSPSCCASLSPPASLSLPLPVCLSFVVQGLVPARSSHLLTA